MGSSAVAKVLARLSEAEAQFSRTQAQAELSKAQAKCAHELKGLSCSHANSPAWASGGIAAVVRLCHEPAFAADAVCALFNLSAAEANWAAITEAGAIPPLVAMLGGPESEAAKQAAEILDRLASDTHTAAAVLEEVARTTANCYFSCSLHAKLLGVRSVIDRAMERLREMYADTERQKRREALGLGSLELPNEFMCPVTLDKMRDPVVASDGFSYERSAIEAVINSDNFNGLSPRNRQPLQPNVLVPNHNLKMRILEFEGNVLDAADEVSRRRDETETSLRQQLASAKQQLAEEITRRDAARGEAAELQGQLEQVKESHAREVLSLREELSGAKRALEADAGMAGEAAAAEGAEGAEGASGGVAGDERRQDGSREKPRLEKRDRTSGSSDRSSA